MAHPNITDGFHRFPVIDGKTSSIRDEPGVGAPMTEDGPLVAAHEGMKAVTKLLRVGMRLAVYGCREAPTPGSSKLQAERQLAKAHIVNPGSYTVPQVPNHPMAGSAGLAHARSLCGISVVTNGFASDYTPPEWELCSRCRERV